MLKLMLVHTVGESNAATLLFHFVPSGFLFLGMFTSDQRWSSHHTLSDGKHDNDRGNAFWTTYFCLTRSLNCSWETTQLLPNHWIVRNPMAISFYTYYCSSWYCVRRVKISLFLDNSVFGWGLDLINHCEKNASDNYRCTSQHTLDGKNRNSIEQIRGKAARQWEQFRPKRVPPPLTYNVRSNSWPGKCTEQALPSIYS